MSEVRQAIDKDLVALNKSLNRYEEQFVSMSTAGADDATRKFVMESITYYRQEVKAARAALIEHAKNVKELR